MIKTKDLGSITYKISFIDGDVRIKIERCGQELADVLKTLKEEFSQHIPDGHRKRLCNYKFKVLYTSKGHEDEPSFHEVSPEKWASLKHKRDWDAYFIEIDDTEGNDFHLDLQLNEWDDDPLVGDMLISLDYWDSLINFLRAYNLITPRQEKRFHLYKN